MTHTPEQPEPSTQSIRAARVLLVDDHPLVRRGLAAVIGGEDDLEVCGEAETVLAAMQMVRTEAPDLVVTDLSLGDGNGLELVKRLRAQDPDLKILVCSMHDERLFAQRALGAGANGYIGKEQATAHVVEAIRHTLSGRTWLSDAMTDLALNGALRTVAGDNGVAGLTDRELAVFELIGRGMGPSQIALQIHLSVKTIETHREKIKRKLGLRSGAELTRRAMQWVTEQI